MIPVPIASAASCEERLRERHDDLLGGRLPLSHLSHLSLLVVGLGLPLRKLGMVMVVLVELGVGLIGDHGRTLIHGFELMHRFHST